MTGALVTLANADSAGGTALEWELVSKPPGSTAQLSDINTASPTFTPDLEGSYLIRLTLDGGLDGTAVAAIKSAALDLRVPVSGETDELGGWEKAVQDIVDTLESAGAVAAGAGAGSFGSVGSTGGVGYTGSGGSSGSSGLAGAAGTSTDGGTGTTEVPFSNARVIYQAGGSYLRRVRTNLLG